MNLNFINKYPSLKSWIIGQLGYYSNKLYKIEGDKLKDFSKSVPKVIIIAKCHYSEKWQSYASVTKKELDKILALKKETNKSSDRIFQVFVNKDIDGFDVKEIIFQKKLFERLGESKIFIPESELFAQDACEQLLDIDTLAGKLFFSNINDRQKSTYAKGIVNSIGTYKLSVGFPQSITSLSISEVEFPKFIISNLLNKNLSSFRDTCLFSFKNWFDYSKLHVLYWVPILSVLVFLIINNSYLWLSKSTTVSMIEQGDESVLSIIAQKQKQDMLTKEFDLFSNELSGVRKTHHDWEVLHHLLKLGMKVNQFYNKDNIAVIRGTAEDAIYILDEIGKYKFVNTVGLQGGVRKSLGNDVFVLNIDIKGDM
ncbi:hypothetical protein Q4493_00960 [Colwellia sp. 1_MG-2023]|uniref:hypothetical protein n=1 Tax=Colwellia sp. 1_MG-2023 TaxID=3062649 RepID=UPI0026E42EE4|nr:hypothetical protein [Colwellia sp. 1_MG-2023]MDO6444333.1 hypothetical protein [Colwellia sp. 1_MG-2023]